jgi:hypothetical protein
MLYVDLHSLFLSRLWINSLDCNLDNDLDSNLNSAKVMRKAKHILNTVKNEFMIPPAVP